MVKTPKIIQKIFSKWIWTLPSSEKKIYLTFDDGPIPEVTPTVLAILEEYQVKATFFCIGDNVRKYPEIVQSILSKNHAIGNHTYSHLKGWKTSTKKYISNTEACQIKLNSLFTIHNSKLFRPPYGKISLWQSYKLRKLGYKIIMWSVLSKDYDASITEETCYKNVVNNTQPGSIIVFHDSLKAKKNMLYSLPKTIAYFKNLGYQFDVIT